MRNSKFSESQIIKALKENQQGRSVGDIPRELGIDNSTFYYWRKKYGGMEQQELKRLKELEAENNKQYINKDKKEIETTDWISCFKRYKKNPNKVLDYLKKGTKVYVDGKPNFGLNTSASGGVFININLDVHNLDFTPKSA